MTDYLLRSLGSNFLVYQNSCLNSSTNVLLGCLCLRIIGLEDPTKLELGAY